MSYITINQRPGNLSAGLSAGNDGLFGKIGWGVGEAKPEKIYTVSSSDYAKRLFGEYSPLTKSCMLHFSQGGSPLKCLVPVFDEGDYVTIAPQSWIMENNLKLSEGEYLDRALDSYEILLKITRTTNSATNQPSYTYKYSINGDSGFTAVSPSDGKLVISKDNASFTITIPSPHTIDDDGEHNLKFSIQQTDFSNEKLSAALRIFQADKDIRMLHLVSNPINTNNASDMESVLSKLHSFCEEMSTKKQWVRAVASVRPFRKDDENESKDNYETYLGTVAHFTSKYVSITYKNVKSKALGEDISESSHLLATLSKAKVHQSPGWTGAFPQEDVLEIKHWDDLKHSYTDFSKLGYESMYYEDGEASGTSPFFGIGRLKTDENSDFRKISAGRVIDKACRLIHSAVFPYLRSNQNMAAAIAGNRAGLLGMKSRMEVSLDGMLGRNEIDGYEINIPMLDNPNMSLAEIANAIVNGEIEGTFNLYPNGHIEHLEIDASYALGI